MMKCSLTAPAPGTRHKSSIYLVADRAGMNRHGCHSWDSSWGRSGPQYLKQNSPFSSRTPNTTDSIHASRWPHPSPGLLLAGHKPRSQSGAVYPQHSVRRKEEQSGIVSEPRPLARARDQLTRTKTYFDSSQPAAAAAACVCKESESEPVRAAAVLCQHHSATIWSQLAPAVRQPLLWHSGTKPLCNSSSSFA